MINRWVGKQPLERLWRFIRHFPLIWRLARMFCGLQLTRRAISAVHRWTDHLRQSREAAFSSNPLQAYFDAHHNGRGIWKWEHYFAIYHRHLSKFVGHDVHVLEVGIYGGGSLDMWRAYFGERCHVYGVDIEPACAVYANDHIRVFIGDQADRAFWKQVKEQVPHLDIVIDDGGHLAEQQIVTLDELLPHLQPGGVYLCEDVHGVSNRFAAYVSDLADSLNAWQWEDAPDGRLTARPTPFQRHIHSIHNYPSITVIERADTPRDTFVATKHGTEWQPFS